MANAKLHYFADPAETDDGAMLTVFYYADTLREVKLAIASQLRRRADSLDGRGRTQKEKAANHLAAFELRAEADWTARAKFEPSANNPFAKESI